jgi:hypothetical protein
MPILVLIIIRRFTVTLLLTRIPWRLETALLAHQLRLIFILRENTIVHPIFVHDVLRIGIASLLTGKRVMRALSAPLVAGNGHVPPNGHLAVPALGVTAAVPVATGWVAFIATAQPEKPPTK